MRSTQFAAVHEYPMVIALFALSLVMIVGGLAAMVQGFPYVRLESGLVMVIGGATAASAGAVLLGVGVAVGQLKRIATLLAEGRGAAGADVAPGFAAALRAGADHAPFEEPPPVASEPRPALVAGAAGLAGVTLGAVAEGAVRGGRRPALEPSFGAPPAPVPAPAAEPPLPGLLPAVEPPTPMQEDDLFAAEAPPAVAEVAVEAEAPVRDEPVHEEPGQEALALRPALEEQAREPEPEPEPQPAEGPAPEPEEKALQVVGTYSSGANTYVMFSDGTIEADTPQGRFNFHNLDELKAFVDSGGETARGAA